MRNRIVITVLFTALSAVWCLFPRVAQNAGNTSYRQGTQRKESKRTARTNRSSARGNSPRDYSRFSHRSDRHKGLDCAACHKASTNYLPAVSGFPDVADYPAHDACIRCHRPQFFKGALPVICSICHTKVSPRAKERFAFGKPNRPSQFRMIFPHDLHQNVIASYGLDKGLESAHALRRATFATDEKGEKYNNCTICHKTQMETLYPDGGFPDNFKPDPGTFKTSPTGHASCFNCHWKNQEPTHENCGKCHGPSQTDTATLQAPKRKSLKFKHVRPGGKHEDECTVCHINITRKTSLVNLEPDVPITKCGPTCHGKQKDKTRVTIATEISKRNKNPDFVCDFCHTSDKGKQGPVRASHNAAK